MAAVGVPLGGGPCRGGARIHQRRQLHPELPRHRLERQQVPAPGPATCFIGRNMVISKPSTQRVSRARFIRYLLSQCLSHLRPACKRDHLAAKVEQPHSSSFNQDLFPAVSFGTPGPFREMFAQWRIVICVSHLPTQMSQAQGPYDMGHMTWRMPATH